MLHSLAAAVLTLLAQFLNPATARVQGQTPVMDASVCGILANPMAYDGRLVRARARVWIGFEDFTLRCEGSAAGQDYLWLEYGSGVKYQPTVWCCGDLTPRDPLKLVQDADFKRFHQLLTAQVKRRGCYDCYLYEITATLTGRVDVAPQQRDANGRSHCVGGGFGHFGFVCVRMVIASVRDVEAVDVSGRYTFGEGRFKGFSRVAREGSLVEISEPFVVRSVRGRVQFRQGEELFPKADALVEIRGPEKKLRIRRVITNAEGEFGIPRVPEGTYLLRATADNMGSVVATLVVSRKADPKARVQFEMSHGK